METMNVEMLVKTGEDEEIQWFDFHLGYFEPVTRIEWDVGTSQAELPFNMARYLIEHKWARQVQRSEPPVQLENVEEVQAAPPSEDVAPQPQKTKKGRSS
jgi:hypothetical protein